MKMKIVSIFVCLMLMTVSLTAAHDVENIPVTHESDIIEPISFNKVDTPVWDVGYKWTYKINRFIIDFDEPDLSFDMNIKIDNLPLEVITVTGDFYELTFNTNINGYIWIIFDLGDGPINISFDFKSTTIEGTMLSMKTDLGLKEIHATISGTIDIKIVEQPYIQLPFKLQKKIDGKIDFDIVMENARQPIVKYPFELLEFWGLPAENFTLDGTIESPLLDKIDLINRRFVNPLLNILNSTINGPTIERLFYFSNILKDILPIIDICKILTDYMGRGCEFKIPAVPEIICCLPKESVTVPAGTFDAYNISIVIGKLGTIFYNETIGGIVKATGNFQEIFPSVSNIEAELISYEHNP